MCPYNKKPQATRVNKTQLTRDLLLVSLRGLDPVTTGRALAGGVVRRRRGAGDLAVPQHALIAAARPLSLAPATALPGRLVAAPLPATAPGAVPATCSGETGRPHLRDNGVGRQELFAHLLFLPARLTRGAALAGLVEARPHSHEAAELGHMTALAR